MDTIFPKSQHMDDLIIVDNALSESESTHLENILTSDAFPYHEGMDIDPHRFASPEECPDIIVSSTAVTTPQLFHVCHNRDNPNNSLYDPYACELSAKILQKVCINQAVFKRIKFNKLLPNVKLSRRHHNVPHVDAREGMSIVYFVNDSDGDTVIFNQKYTGEVKRDVTVRHRIAPAKGKAVIFKSDVFHCSSNPIVSDFRIVMNVTFSMSENGKVLP
jgi:hypothetical protein